MIASDPPVTARARAAANRRAEVGRHEPRQICIFRCPTTAPPRPKHRRAPDWRRFASPPGHRARQGWRRPAVLLPRPRRLAALRAGTSLENRACLICRLPYQTWPCPALSSVRDARTLQNKHSVQARRAPFDRSFCRPQVGSWFGRRSVPRQRASGTWAGAARPLSEHRQSPTGRSLRLHVGDFRRRHRRAGLERVGADDSEGSASHRTW